MRIFTLIFIGLAVLLPAPDSQAVPVQWSSSVGGNDHFYDAILEPDGIEWSDANAAAQSLGNDWHLATVTSAAENSFIFSLFSGNAAAFSNCCLSNNSNGPWLGGFSTSVGSNDWQWVTGEAFTFDNWGPLEPFGNGDRISYFGFRSATAGSIWNDVRDSGGGLPPRGYIIETPTNPQVGVPEPSSVMLFALALISLAVFAQRGRLRSG